MLKVFFHTTYQRFNNHADHGEEATVGLVQNSHTLLVGELLLETVHRSEFHYEMILSPTMDAMSVVMKNKRQKVADSLKKKIPTSTVPTAPMPVQTG